MVSDLCPRLQKFSDTFCIEKDIQNYVFRSLVEAYGRIMVRSDRMDLSAWHYSLIAINPVMRLLNREFRAPYSFQPLLFDFEVNVEMNYQLRHFVTEFKHSMARIEARTVSIQSHTLKQSLDTAYNAFERFQGRVDEKRADNSYNYIRFIPNSWRPEGMKSLDSYYDFATRVMNQLKALDASLNTYDVDIAEMRRQHKTLLDNVATVRHFEMERTGLIWIPKSELGHFQNVSFIDFQNPSDQQQNSTDPGKAYPFNLDTIITPSDLSALRLMIVEICSGETNSKIVSGSLHTICIIWRHIKAISAFDHSLLSPVQRSWGFEQIKAIEEHRVAMGYDAGTLAATMQKKVNFFQTSHDRHMMEPRSGRNLTRITRGVVVGIVNMRRPCDEKCEQVRRDAQQRLTSDITMSLIFGRIAGTAILYQDIGSIIIVNRRLSSKSTGCI